MPLVPNALPWYALSDFFALVSDIESMPRSLMESMYIGVPVLASNVYGVPELIEDSGTGLLVEANRISDLVDRLDYALSLPQADLRELTGRARRLIHDNYQSSNYARSYLALFSELTGMTLP